MTSAHDVFSDAWFFSPDGRLVSELPADDCGPKNKVGRALLALAPHSPSVWRRMRPGGAEGLFDFLGHLLHVFKKQAGLPPLQGWLLLRAEVTKVQASTSVEAVAARLTGAGCATRAEDLKALLEALRHELLMGLLSVHGILAAAENRWEWANEFLGLLPYLGSESEVRQWSRVWPIGLRIKAVEQAPITQRLAALVRLLQQVEGAERRAVIVKAEGTADAMRHLPDESLTLLLRDIDELSRVCPESWPINQWVAGLHFREAERLAGRREYYDAARHFASASAHAPEYADIRDWLRAQLEHLNASQRRQIEQELESPGSRRLEKIRLDSRRLSVALRLGLPLDEQGSGAARVWLARAVQEGAVPPDSPASLSGLSAVLGEGMQAAEAWIIANVKPPLDTELGAENADFVEHWQGVLAANAKKRPGKVDAWTTNRWLTTAKDMPAKLLAGCGVVALVVGISMGGYRAWNLRSRDAAFAASARAWAVGDAANARQDARRFLRLLPDDSKDARADLVANRLRLSTLQGLGALQSQDVLADAKEDLRLAKRWIEHGATRSRAEN